MMIIRWSGDSPRSIRREMIIYRMKDNIEDVFHPKHAIDRIGIGSVIYVLQKWQYGERAKSYTLSTKTYTASNHWILYTEILWVRCIWTLLYNDAMGWSRMPKQNTIPVSILNELTKYEDTNFLGHTTTEECKCIYENTINLQANMLFTWMHRFGLI